MVADVSGATLPCVAACAASCALTIIQNIEVHVANLAAAPPREALDV